MSAVFINLLLFWQSQNFVINFPIAMKLLKTAMIQRAWRNQIYGLIRETCNNVQLFLSVFAREVIVSEWRQCGYYYLTDSLWFCWHSHAHGQACDLLVIFDKEVWSKLCYFFPFLCSILMAPLSLVIFNKRAVSSLQIRWFTQNTSMKCTLPAHWQSDLQAIALVVFL